MRSFLAGSLAAEDEQAIARHLEERQSCERLAAELSDDREARELARDKRRAATNTAATAEMDDLCRRLHALGRLSMAVESAGRAVTNTNDGATEIGQAGSTARELASWKIRAGDINQDDHPRLTQIGSYDVVRS